MLREVDDSTLNKVNCIGFATLQESNNSLRWMLSSVQHLVWSVHCWLRSNLSLFCCVLSNRCECLLSRRLESLWGVHYRAFATFTVTWQYFSFPHWLVFRIHMVYALSVGVLFSLCGCIGSKAGATKFLFSSFQFSFFIIDVMLNSS